MIELIIKHFIDQNGSSWNVENNWCNSHKVLQPKKKTLYQLNSNAWQLLRFLLHIVSLKIHVHTDRQTYWKCRFNGTQNTFAVISCVYHFVSICLSFLHSFTYIHIFLYRIAKHFGIQITIQCTNTLIHSHWVRKRDREEREKQKVENVLLSLSPRWTRQVIYVKYLQEIIVNYEKTSFVFPVVVVLLLLIFFLFCFPFDCLKYEKKEKRDFDSRYNEILIYLFKVLRASEWTEWTTESIQCKFESKYNYMAMRT